MSYFAIYNVVSAVCTSGRFFQPPIYEYMYTVVAVGVQNRHGTIRALVPPVSSQGWAGQAVLPMCAPHDGLLEPR